ncbi:hypothetical protein C799_02907 [Bacteroides thetaiotaomicron dnLKV9]|uniref:Uncharacterized protein n=1 Tax=Bacteroides thetaiotaomicron dnLKV9 TaxID=1235785 RepID=R9HAV4_BACT4|nr:hypothetical protein C799_02907 [Bacteroides thetaiotaomicron dnLKV9]
MLKWLIIGTLLYYAILLWRYRDSLGTWFTGEKRKPEQPESKPTVKTENSDCLVGASRYRMGQMRTNGDILGHLSKGVNNASIFVPKSDEAEEERPALQAIDTEFEMEFETEEPDISPDEIEAEEIACYMGGGEPEMAQGVTLGNWDKWYRSFRLSKRPKRKNGKRYKPSAGRKQTCFIRWWNRLTGAGHGWRNFYKSMRYPYPSPSRLPEMMKWQPLT